MPVPAHPSTTYDAAALALHQMVGDDMPPIASPFSPANALSIGLLGIRSSVRELDGAVKPVVIFTLDEAKFPGSREESKTTLLSLLAQAGVPLPNGDVEPIVELAEGMQRIPPAVWRSPPVSPNGWTRDPRGDRYASGAVPPTIGDAIATVVTPLDRDRMFTMGGTLGGLVSVATVAGTSTALVSCSHCIALSDPADGLTPAAGDLVIPMRHSEHVLTAADPRRFASATLDRWSTMSDPVDVALATLLDESAVTSPTDPYLRPMVEDRAVVGEIVWMRGAGTERLATGLVDSINAIAYVVNPDGSPTWYRELMTVGGRTRDGWAPVTSPGDSGAWVLAWRNGHVAAVGMAGLMGVPSGRPRAHAFTLAYRMDQVFRQLERTLSVDGRNGVVPTTTIDRIVVDGRRAERALPQPDWLSVDSHQHAASLPEESTMDKPHCVTFNLHFHPSGSDESTARHGAAAEPVARTGFTYFRYFRISAGSLNNASGRPIRRVTVTRRNVPNAGGTALVVFDYGGVDAAAIPSGKAGQYHFPNAGEYKPKQLVVEIVEGPSATDPNPRTTSCEINLDSGIPGFLGEVDLQLAAMTNNWRTHYSYAYELTDYATIRETMKPLDFP